MLTGNPKGLVERAYVFAKAAHESVGQRRKYTGEPYVTHPIAVAGIVATVEHTPEMLAAALLHDTVEDTPVTIEDVEREFGSCLSSLVAWLTDISRPEDGNRATRKRLDRDHISQAPAAAQTIKLADLLDNNSNIVEHDPRFAAVYLREKAELLAVLKNGNAVLWMRANAVLQAGLLKIQNGGEDAPCATVLA